MDTSDLPHTPVRCRSDDDRADEPGSRDREDRGGTGQASDLAASAVPALLAVAALLLLPLAAPAAPDQSAESGQEVGPEASSAPAEGNAASADVYRARPVETEIEVDARLDEAGWENAALIRVPWEWKPGDNAPAPVETTCRVTYDEDALYLGCRARDPDPGAIRANLADRDESLDDDHVRVLLDTFDDQRRAYEFRVNPLGVQMDALFAGRSDFSWDGIWDSDGRITENGYVVEVSIPFETLSFPDRARRSQSWGIIVGRTYPRSRRHRLRSIRTDQSDSCLLCQADRLTGLKGISSGHRLEFDPTLTTKRTDARPEFTADDLRTGDIGVEPGLTAQWGVTSNLTLDATVNPDFSQVEADVARLQTNRRFAVRYPEKRPFFQEGADLFQVPGNLVHTRTVVNPVAGAKFTGKAGPHAIGAFVTRDRVNSLLLPGPHFSDQTLLEEGRGSDVTTGVARYRRDVGGSSTVGGLVTARAGQGYHNVLASSDGQFRVSPGTSLWYQAAGTLTDYPSRVASSFDQPAGQFAGRMAGVGFNHRTREWRAWGNLLSVGEGFRADAGFLPQSGLHGAQASAERSFWSDGAGWFTRFRVGARGTYHVDPDGNPARRVAQVSGRYEGPLQSDLYVNASYGDQYFAGRLFTLRQHDLGVGFQPTGALSVSLNGTVGDEIDFANARKGDLLRIGPELTWSAGRHLDLEASHDLQQLSREGRQVFEANLTQLNVRYHLSVEAYLRGVLQYRNVSRNPAMYGTDVSPESEQLFTQLLFSYKLDPRTKLFLGYSGNRQGVRQIDLRQTDRTFFMKIGYAVRP